MPELTQFESGKSTIRYFPANGTAASDRSAVSALSALRSPPARMSASVRSIFAPLPIVSHAHVWGTIPAIRSGFRACGRMVLLSMCRWFVSLYGRNEPATISCLSLAKRSLLSVGGFPPGRAENHLQQKRKYHAAAGYRGAHVIVCVALAALCTYRRICASRSIIYVPSDTVTR